MDTLYVNDLPSGAQLAELLDILNVTGSSFQFGTSEFLPHFIRYDSSV